MTRSRAGWDETWMAVADAMARRSACDRAQVGCAIVDPSNRIVATGYNGPPAGLVTARCEMDCMRNRADDVAYDYSDCIAVHAEMNALMFCDRRHREGGTLYVTGAICHACAKAVANSGVTRVVLRVLPSEAHRDPATTIQLLRDSGLSVQLWERS